MGRTGFFQALLEDQSWGERNALNQAHDKADAAAIAGTDTTFALTLLQRRVMQQRKETEELRIALAVLCQVLRDTKVLDAKMLDYRLEAAMEELEDATGETKPAPALTSCARCGAHVPVTNTVMSPSGAICDACFAAG